MRVLLLRTVTGKLYTSVTIHLVKGEMIFMVDQSIAATLESQQLNQKDIGKK